MLAKYSKDAVGLHSIYRDFYNSSRSILQRMTEHDYSDNKA